MCLVCDFLKDSYLLGLPAKNLFLEYSMLIYIS